MDKLLKVILTLSAVDRMSAVVRKGANKSIDDLDRLNKKSRELISSGAGYAASGVAIMASLAPAVKAYAQLEDSATSLKTAMMDANGAVGPEFEKMNQLAEQLGDKLPGNTSDFQMLFETLRNNGIPAAAIINGIGKSAAYLGVALKMPYDEAGKFAAKMKEATGVADSEMIKFMDTIARTRNMGVDAQEMQYAFGRSAGSLKLLGLQGLEASKSMAAVYASLIRAGLSGETVGTGFAAITASMLDPKKYAAAKVAAHQLGVDLQFFKDGKFLGIENMIAQLDKLKNFSPGKRQSVVNALTGGGQDAQMLQTLINNGVSGFNKLNAEMKNQADLNTKVEARLMTLNSMWEAATGTIDNMLAALGAGLAPELKKVTALMGAVASAVKTFLQSNPAFAKFVGITTAAVGIFVTLIGVIKMIRGVMIALNIVMSANPFILIATLAILALSYIYSNWDKIKAWFSKLWTGIKNVFAPIIGVIKTILLNFTPIGLIIKFWKPLTRFFSALWGLAKAIFGVAIGILKKVLLNFTPIGLIYKHWDKISAFFSKIWDAVKEPFMKIFKWVWDFGAKFVDAGVNIINSIVKGITKSMDKVTNKIKEVTQNIRDFFPFSPARTGPLRDIHKIKLVETIAGSIKSKPLTDAVRRVTMDASVSLGLPRGGRPQMMGAPASGGGMVVHFSPQISGGGNADDIMKQLRAYMPQFMQMIKAETEKENRRSFG